MASGVTVIAGIPIPSTSPVFLALVGLHVMVAAGAVVSAGVAISARKAPGRHPWAGRLYLWCLGATVAFALLLTALRPAVDWPLAVFGSGALAAALYGRWTRRRTRPGWGRRHILAMTASVVLMLIAFYIDNGRNLPLWNRLPEPAYWLIPTLAGAVLAGWMLAKHPVARL